MELAQSDLVWKLESWIFNPAHLIPGRDLPNHVRQAWT